MCITLGEAVREGVERGGDAMIGQGACDGTTNLPARVHVERGAWNAWSVTAGHSRSAVSGPVGDSRTPLLPHHSGHVDGECAGGP